MICSRIFMTKHPLRLMESSSLADWSEILNTGNAKAVPPQQPPAARVAAGGPPETLGLWKERAHTMLLQRDNLKTQVHELSNRYSNKLKDTEAMKKQIDELGTMYGQKVSEVAQIRRVCQQLSDRCVESDDTIGRWVGLE